jgi:Gluconolactonase
VIWGEDGYLYAGGEAGQIYRVDVVQQNYVQIASTGGAVLGMAIDGAGNIYACDREQRIVARVTPDGGVSRFATGTSQRPFTFPNYPVFDPVGNLYVSDSGEWDNPSGCIFRIAPGGEATVWSTSVPHFTNGLALEPTSGELYVVESTHPRVSKIPIRLDGSAGVRETVVELPGAVPDGLAFDQEGRLYIACYRPDRIYRLDPDGRLHVFADDPQGTLLGAPTNVCFGGPKLKSLFVANLGRWHIGRIDVDVPGAKLNHP